MELRTNIRKVEDIGNGINLFSIEVDRYRDKEAFHILLDKYKNGEIIVLCSFEPDFH